MGILRKSILLGVLQGLTEFLPISSSGHLVIAQSLLPNFNQPGALLEATLHLGTLGAVLLYFRRDFLDVLSPGNGDPGRRRLLELVIIGTLPTALIGLIFQAGFERLYESASLAGLMLLLNGLLLFTIDRVRDGNNTTSGMRYWQGLVVGVAQAIAIVPGISRSGSTIAAGVFSGFGRTLAMRFSFMLSVPAILGAFILQSATYAGQANAGGDLVSYGIGGLTALLIGYASISVLLRLLVSRHLSYFAYYCWVLGLAVLLFG